MGRSASPLAGLQPTYRPAKYKTAGRLRSVSSPASPEEPTPEPGRLSSPGGSRLAENHGPWAPAGSVCPPFLPVSR